jgi:hypothetical protein
MVELDVKARQPRGIHECDKLMLRTPGIATGACIGKANTEDSVTRNASRVEHG